MKTTMKLLLSLTLLLGACTADGIDPGTGDEGSFTPHDVTPRPVAPRLYPTEAVAVDQYCTHVCSWADKCGQYAPDACGELCDATKDCVATCFDEVCDRPGVDCDAATPPVDDRQLEACFEGVDASMRDCTEYRPNPPSCEGAFGPVETP